MPQTSPMNWLVLSMLMIMSIMYSLSSMNEKNNVKMTNTNKFNISIKPWNW